MEEQLSPIGLDAELGHGDGHTPRTPPVPQRLKWGVPAAKNKTFLFQFQEKKICRNLELWSAVPQRLETEF